MGLSLRATTFLEQLTLHRAVQNALHILNSAYNKHRSEEYKFNCTVIHNPTYYLNFLGYYLNKFVVANHTLTFSLKVPMLIGPGWGQRKTELLRIRSQIYKDMQRERS